MESSDSVARRLELITRSQGSTAARLRSPLWAYAVLGLLWAAPLGAFALGRSWALFTGLVVVAVTVAWMALFTRRRGVTLRPFSPGSRGAQLAGWMLAGWFVCAVAAFASGTAAPLVTVIAAAVAAVLVAILSVRIERAAILDASAA